MSKHYQKPARALFKYEAKKKRNELIEALCHAWNQPQYIANVHLYFEKNGKGKHIAFRVDQSAPEFAKFLHDYATRLVAERGMEWVRGE